MPKTASEDREYRAIVWPKGSDGVGHRVTIWAKSSAEATERLRAEYGRDCVITVSNDEDAARPR